MSTPHRMDKSVLMLWFPFANSSANPVTRDCMCSPRSSEATEEAGDNPLSPLQAPHEERQWMPMLEGLILG